MTNKYLCGVLAVCFCSVASAAAQGEDLVIDSRMSRSEALAHVSPACPDSILDAQEVVELRYYSFDGKVHRGQLVIDRRLADDIREIFELAFSLKFPVQSVIPLADPRFRQEASWSDERSMSLNNTSAFNYRVATGGKKLSRHARGFAIDINPRQNPYIKGNLVLPEGAVYDPGRAGTLTADHPIVQAFLSRGWTWGGQWKTLKDYQHFEKIP